MTRWNSQHALCRSGAALAPPRPLLQFNPLCRDCLPLSHRAAVPHLLRDGIIALETVLFRVATRCRKVRIECVLQGWRTSMEDAHAAELAIAENTAFFGVYDGACS
eukprot:1194920-Rhodomonas_salina.2